MKLTYVGKADWFELQFLTVCLIQFSVRIDLGESTLPQALNQ